MWRRDKRGYSTRRSGADRRQRSVSVPRPSGTTTASPKSASAWPDGCPIGLNLLRLKSEGSVVHESVVEWRLISPGLTLPETDFRRCVRNARSWQRLPARRGSDLRSCPCPARRTPTRFGHGNGRSIGRSDQPVQPGFRAWPAYRSPAAHLRGRGCLRIDRAPAHDPAHDGIVGETASVIQALVGIPDTLSIPRRVEIPDFRQRRGIQVFSKVLSS